MSLLCVILLQLEVLVLGEPRREDKTDAKRKEKGSKIIERYEEGVADVRGRRGIDCLLEVTGSIKENISDRHNHTEATPEQCEHGP